ncbi:MAG TPA: hypothetical protein VGL56_19675 [Fimbriimonadaceae bacterium]|jgi:hypothetical protein
MNLRAGYSGKPLADKLGIKLGHAVAVINKPEGFEIEGLPVGLPLLQQLEPNLNLVLYFTSSLKELEKCFPKLIESTVQNGSIWISWPKKASGLATDLNENLVRDTGLAVGVVDVKVCAVDETWSGLKFVRRLTDRTKG